jgi:hypothetical protein
MKQIYMKPILHLLCGLLVAGHSSHAETPESKPATKVVPAPKKTDLDTDPFGTNAKEDKRDLPPDGIYTQAKEGTFQVPPELRLLKKTQSPFIISNAQEFGFDEAIWQSDPSRIIFHDGKYHCWFINGYARHKKDGMSWILYITSVDTFHWKAEGYVPLGPKGSCYDLEIEQADVVHHEGKFYLFSEGGTKNVTKYGQKRAGIFCLVADQPEGPWTQVGDLLVKPEMDGGKSWDSVHVNNPRHVFINGKWLMYYKSRRTQQEQTRNGVAIAESLTGPYRKFEGNPQFYGHGLFTWRYAEGVLMMPFAAASGSILCWSQDGLRFSPPIVRGGDKLFIFGSLYLPNDPLCGKPVTNQLVTKYWGFESVNRTPNKKPGNWDLVRIELEFGATSKP